MVDSIFFGIAAALWVAVWAMHPTIDADKCDSKDAPLDRTPARKGEQQ